MAKTAAFEKVCPILPVRDLRQALAYYERLGFKLAFGGPSSDPADPGGYAGVRRDGVEIHLQFQFEKDFKAGTAGQCMLRFIVDDPDALYEEYAAKGLLDKKGFVDKKSQVRDTSWGTREFAFFDLNGNGLTFFRDL
jgi:catechol 2,3-dioxygenase-like lactoylglutathione lyase family enzyme